MSSTEFTARRALSAVAIAIAAVTGPLLAPAAAVGDPAPGCTNQSTPGNDEVSCTAPSVQPSGAPSETDLSNDTDSGGGGPLGGPGGPGR